MSDLARLAVLVIVGFLAGVLLRRWWLLAVIAAGWLLVGGLRLASHGSDEEPSVEWMLLVVLATVVGAVAATALGIAIGRALAPPANKEKSAD